MSKSPFDSLDTSLLRSTREDTNPQEKADSSQPTKSIDHTTNQSINQSMNRAIEQSIASPSPISENRVMDKPRGFYITEQVNQRIDKAVRYFQEKHGLKKVDRSIVVTAILENEALWTDEALDLLL